MVMWASDTCRFAKSVAYYCIRYLDCQLNRMPHQTLVHGMIGFVSGLFCSPQAQVYQNGDLDHQLMDTPRCDTAVQRWGKAASS